MSFFSKLNSKFEGMMKDDNENQQQQSGQRGKSFHFRVSSAEDTVIDHFAGYEQQQQPYGYNGYPPQQQQAYNPQPSYSTPQYQSPPPQQVQQWVAPPSQTPSYTSPPPQQYGAFSRPAAALPPTPGVPQGWLPLWDPAGQRWAYLDLPNNIVSWSVPVAPAFAQGRGGYDASRGAGGYGGGYGAGGGYQEQPKDNSKKNMMMGAAAGVAVGTVGGVLLANALGE
jgi:hypothetical protein